ncbi:MAG: homocysteine S-methyltransferase family protein, partial [Anaerolineae bacterium]|nr:homocysteine S-methyltransferase family protein [Anaerolineae bacterium]
MSHPFLDRLARGPVLGDGAMGTMLHARGAALDQCLEQLNLTRPDWVREIHLAYIRAGAEIIQTNTFAASRPRLTDFGLADQTREINFRGVKLAREAREISGQSVLIAGSVGPLGRRVRRGQQLMVEAAEAAFGEQIGVLWEAGADLLILETFSDLNELIVAVRVARAACDLPVVAEVTFGNDGVTADGAGPADVAHALARLGVDVAGINCSLGPARIAEFLAEMHAAEP